MLQTELATAEFMDDFERYGHESEANIVINKGFFEYFAVEGSYEGEDYPIGFDEETKMGDYYRYLVPSAYAPISDFPKDFHHIIAVSTNLDFTIDRLISNDEINKYFPSCYS